MRVFGGRVFGECDGVVTHGSAKAIAVPYLDPSEVVCAFVHRGEIVADDADEFMSGLLRGADVDVDDYREGRLLALLRDYVAARIECGAVDEVSGWPVLDVARECAPWDVGLDEYLECGGEVSGCGGFPPVGL